MGDLLYMLSKGRVEVVKWGKVGSNTPTMHRQMRGTAHSALPPSPFQTNHAQTQIRIAVLEEGSHFGEAAFLCDPSAPPPKRRRWASIYALTYCDVRYLSRTRLEAVLLEMDRTGKIRRADVAAVFAERYAETARDQKELDAICVAEFPHVMQEWEQQVRARACVCLLCGAEGADVCVVFGGSWRWRASMTTTIRLRRRTYRLLAPRPHRALCHRRGSGTRRIARGTMWIWMSPHGCRPQASGKAGGRSAMAPRHRSSVYMGSRRRCIKRSPGSRGALAKPRPSPECLIVCQGGAVA
jgi:hypothetical protein